MKNCAYCKKELAGITPVILYRKSRFSILRLMEAEFCSQECEDLFLKRKNEKAISQEAVDFGDELDDIAAELRNLAEKLYSYSSLPREARDPSELDEMRMKLIDLSRPNFSQLVKIENELKAMDPEFQAVATKLAAIDIQYSIPGWTLDLPGLAAQCDSSASNLERISDDIDAVNFPKKP
jgi:hypothetical protein